MSDYAKAKPDLRPSYFIIDPYRQKLFMTPIYLQAANNFQLCPFKSIGFYHRAISIALPFVLSACTHYQPLPLTAESIQQQLQTPSREQLTIQAAKIKHPLLKPVKFDREDGLSPDKAAILAVLRNPQLRAVRDQHGIANAQLLQAGLLPDPQVSYSFSAPSGGTAPCWRVDPLA